MDETDAPFAFAPPLWLDEATSTNDVLRERLASGVPTPPGTVVAARRQTRGKGRMGGVWQSSPKGDLTFSFYWASRRSPLVAATLPMACALGVRDFLALPPWRIPTRCKWPNDVLAGEAKICGILAEAAAGRDGGLDLVVGIGVNLRPVPGRDAALGRATAAMEDFCPGAGEPEALLPPLLEVLAGRLRLWSRGGFPALRGDLEACLWGVGRRIATKTAAGRVQGVVAGLGEGGELLLRRDDGGIVAVASVTALEGWDLG